MGEEYPVFKIHYGLDSNPSLFAEVSPSGSDLCDRLTECERLLKNSLGKKGKGYVFHSIERIKDTSKILGVISNAFASDSLTSDRRIDAMEPGDSEMGD